MNDFTKDELYTLFKCIRLVEIDYGECADLDNVRYKIGHMIENHIDNGQCHHGVKAVNCFVCYQENPTLEDRETLLKVPYEES